MYKFLTGIFLGFAFFICLWLLISNYYSEPSLIGLEVGMLTYSIEPDIMTGRIVGERYDMEYGRSYDIKFDGGPGVKIELSVDKKILDKFFIIKGKN